MKYILLFIFTVLLSLPSYGSVVIMGTRVIYPAEQKSINVRLNNGDSTPSLIQAWLDTGDPSSPPDSVRVPFIITPPVFRMEPLSGQTMRIMYTGEKLPADRESLFWLNVLDIPAKPSFAGKSEKAQGYNYLQFAVRSRIKFFFRPDGLPFSPDDAYKKVTWQLTGGDTLQASNPTPYFITFSTVSVGQGAQKVSSTQGGMAAPFSSVTFRLKQKVSPSGKVEWTVVNDNGGYQKGESVVK
ncbi:TPA: fimbria/pilus periplasmic chaperone [Escherichia coli]|nr:fimbria/pilus periplasmic chaperone [Escherichia coli]